MVATVLRLRYRVLGNTLRRSPWQIVGFCFGMLGALWMLFLVGAGAVALAMTQPLETARVVAVIAGSGLLLGWVLGPVLIAGTEATVTEAHLAQFPLRRPQIQRSLAAVGLTGIPGIATTLACLASVVLWLRAPLAAVVAVPCVAIAVLTCVVASRLATTLSAGLGGNRRGREAVGTVVLILLMLTGPIIAGAALLARRSADLGESATMLADVLGWTPIGAAWAVPGDLATGQWLPAIARFAIAAATLAVLWILWGRALDASAASSQQRATRAVKTGALGLFGRFPTGGVGATWARALTAWLRDPRYLRSLIVVPLFPVIFGVTTGVEGLPFRGSAILAAFVLAIAGYTDISYDGTAFASVLATGVRGRADRLGRLLATACVAIPLVVLVAVVTTLIAGTTGDLPAVLGASIGLLLAGFGVSAVSSTLLVMPVAKPGDSPFKSVPGQSFLTGMAVFLVLGACMLLGAPSLVLAVISFVLDSAALGWAALGAGVVVGLAAIVAGVAIGGRLFDRRGPEILARIKSFPTT